MEELAKFITDERTGLKYELCDDYYIVAGANWRVGAEAFAVHSKALQTLLQQNAKRTYAL